MKHGHKEKMKRYHYNNNTGEKVKNINEYD